MPVHIADISLPGGHIAGIVPLGDGGLVYWDHHGELGVSRPQPSGAWRSEALHRAHRAAVQVVLPLGAVRLLSLSRAELVLSDTQTGAVLLRDELSGAPTALLPLGEDAFAVWGRDATVRICDAFTGEDIRVLSGHPAPLTTVDAAGEHLVTTSRDGTLRRWHWASGRCEQCLELPGGNDLEGSRIGTEGLALVWSGSWLWACDLAAGTVRKVRAGEDAEFGYGSAKGFGFDLRDARNLGDERLLTLCDSEEESIKLWDADTLSAKASFFFPTGDRAENVFAVTAGAKLNECWETAGGAPPPADAPSLGIWVQGRISLCRFDVALSRAIVHHPPQLHSRAIGMSGRKMGPIRKAMLSPSGRPVSYSDSDATVWVAQDNDDPRMAVDFIPLTFLPSEAGDILTLRLLATGAAGGEQCVVAQGTRVSVWNLGA